MFALRTIQRSFQRYLFHPHNATPPALEPVLSDGESVATLLGDTTIQSFCSSQLSPTQHNFQECKIVGSDKSAIRGFEVHSDSDLESSGDQIATRPVKHEQTLQNVCPLPMLFPRSSCDDFQPPLPLLTEREAIGNLFNLNEGCTEIEVEDFVVYRPLDDTKNSGELSALQDFRRNETYLFDGIVRVGAVMHYVKNVEFKRLRIDYHKTAACPSDLNIWLQSRLMLESQDWGSIRYKLKYPAPEYARFFEPFLWLAHLARHIFHFIEQETAPSTLSIFRTRFYDHLQSLHGGHQAFERWSTQYGSTDFRKTIACNARFLYRQAVDLDRSNGSNYSTHPLWNETRASPLALPAVLSEQKASRPKDGRTTFVTPYVYHRMKCKEWEPLMRVLNPCASTYGQFLGAKGANVNHAFITKGRKVEQDKKGKRPKDKPLEINVGDVIKICRGITRTSKWKVDDKYWYAYVLKVECIGTSQGLRVLWLAKPGHTPCDADVYPHKKELFLTDHCNCEGEPLPYDAAIGKESVTFFGVPENHLGSRFFVRQHVSQYETFRTLENKHLKCQHFKEALWIRYLKGDTVLVQKHSLSKTILEPVELMGRTSEITGSVTARKLLRKARDFYDQAAAPNELVYTYQYEQVSVADIIRKCHIRFFSIDDQKDSKIPAPYSRQGTGDAYFIIYAQLQTDSQLIPMDPNQASMTQGFDPAEEFALPKLKGLDLFCGGGSFGRGLEEGGAIKMKWAVDKDENAIMTYRANLPDPGDVNLYWGDVNQFNRSAIEDPPSDLIPQQGDVDCVACGSSCKGLSNANPNKKSLNSIQNNILLASALTTIDIYRPSYAIMENVEGLVSSGLLARIFSTLVGMGYQVRLQQLDAWSFGSPQSRTRVFIGCSAPGLAAWPIQPPTHSHPDKTRNRALGRGANGLGLAARDLDVVTPFPYTSIAKATDDLTPNPDGRTRSIRFPDHQPCTQLSTRELGRVNYIPTYTPAASLITAYHDGLIPQHDINENLPFWNNIKSKNRNANCWRRNDADGLCPTITTSCSPGDAFMGRLLHWAESRCLSVSEARIANGCPDKDIILGNLREQWKINGNSVARTVSMASGMALRTMCLESAANNGTSKRDVHTQTTSETTLVRRAKSVLLGNASHEEPPQKKRRVIRRNLLTIKSDSSGDVAPITVGEPKAVVKTQKSYLLEDFSDFSDNEPLAKRRKIVGQYLLSVKGDDSSGDEALIKNQRSLHKSISNVASTTTSPSVEASETVTTQTICGNTRITTTTTICRERIVPPLPPITIANPSDSTIVKAAGKSREKNKEEAEDIAQMIGHVASEALEAKAMAGNWEAIRPTPVSSRERPSTFRTNMQASSVPRYSVRASGMKDDPIDIN